MGSGRWNPTVFQTIIVAVYLAFVFHDGELYPHQDTSRRLGEILILTPTPVSTTTMAMTMTIMMTITLILELTLELALGLTRTQIRMLIMNILQTTDDLISRTCGTH